MPTHAEARAILYDAWRRAHGSDPSDAELSYAQAIAYLETGYGRAGQFGTLASQGAYNWGALETRRGPDGECPAGTLPGSDLGPVCFYAFPDDVSAATAFIRTLTIGGGGSRARAAATLAAMRSGSPEDVAAAMRVAPAYYGGQPGTTETQKVDAYASAIRRSLAAAGNPVPSGGGSTTAAAVLGLWLVLGAAAYAFYETGGVGAVKRALA